MFKKLIALFKKKPVEVKEEKSQDKAYMISSDEAVKISQTLEDFVTQLKNSRASRDDEWESVRSNDIGDLIIGDLIIGDLIIEDKKSEDSRLPTIKPQKSSKKKSKKNKKRKKKK
jgi:hypothetical protein